MAATAPASVPAAQYVRMSTEHQKYSTTFQSATNEAYALERGYRIVRTYSDEGVSGLSLDRREALKQLLADVLSGSADYRVVLVYDVSRWGRFQDPDESAHYEFICRAAGVGIEYCAEPFSNDGSMTSTIVKHLKRAMAAEYSRELSVKVSRAKRGLAQQGYWCGSATTYGFRRCILNPDGSRGLVLEPGQRKALQGWRTVLVAGPEHEVQVVRRIFREYVIEGLSPLSIARRLAAEGVAFRPGQQWDRNRVRRILQDEKYGGVLVSGRVLTHLKVGAPVARADWIRVQGACPALVDPEMSAMARANLPRRAGSTSDAELLEALREALALHGRLSANVLRRCPFTPGVGFYRKRFGTLMNAYRLAGYVPSQRQVAVSARMDPRGPPGPPPPYRLSDAELLARLRRLHERTGRVTCALIDNDPDLPCAETTRRRFGGLMRICELVDCTPTSRQARAAAASRRKRLSAAAWLRRNDRRLRDAQRAVESQW